MAESARTLQAALDDWTAVAPRLEHEAVALARHAREDSFAFDANHCHAPLPRAFQWADGSAYVNHVALVRRARGAERSEEHTSELQSLMRISYAVFCLKKKTTKKKKGSI